jgi:hypothetical protein
MIRDGAVGANAYADSAKQSAEYEISYFSVGYVTTLSISSLQTSVGGRMNRKECWCGLISGSSPAFA